VEGLRGMLNQGWVFSLTAEKQRAIVPLMIGHRALATSLLCTGDITEGREHYNHNAGIDRATNRVADYAAASDCAIASH
jgi:hypothetical protein